MFHHEFHAVAFCQNDIFTIFYITCVNFCFRDNNLLSLQKLEIIRTKSYNTTNMASTRFLWILFLMFMLLGSYSYLLIAPYFILCHFVYPFDLSLPFYWSFIFYIQFSTVFEPKTSRWHAETLPLSYHAELRIN